MQARYFADDTAAHLLGRISELTGQWFSERFEHSIARGDTWLPPTVLGRHVPRFIRALANCISGGAIDIGRLPTAHVVHDPGQALEELDLLGQIIFGAVREYAVSRARDVPVADLLAVVERGHGCLTSLTRLVLSEYFAENRRRADRAQAQSHELLSTIGHELRSRVRLATMALDAMDGGHDPCDRARLLQQLHRTLGHLDALAGEVASIHTDGRTGSTGRRAALSVLVGQALEQVRIAAEQTGVHLQVSSEIPTHEVDAARLELVLVNLLTRAIEHRDPDQSNPWVRVDVFADERGGYRIDVCDNGVGVASEYLERIFDRRRVDHASGDGVGLSLAHRALLQLGSTLEVDSTPGQGTVFSFRLLLLPDDEPV